MIIPASEALSENGAKRIEMKDAQIALADEYFKDNINLIEERFNVGVRYAMEGLYDTVHFSLTDIEKMHPADFQTRLLALLVERVKREGYKIIPTGNDGNYYGLSFGLAG